ncbi:heat shock protein DnaJ [Trypanosoma conorhini]|uniref:Heat shock protein DnaJ n=1 Tax=Trypanosoma conorhini TaxID=83891 RepID=A0A3R7M7V3_9TRYP|nr:heat shock protein DnaJ [Trypanosoma conorhini]RNF10651.1 heat shock protein DnaJ [Trypanosoma conorhini]
MFFFPDEMNGMLNDFVSGMPGGFPFAGGRRRKQRVSYSLPVTLSDLYNGKSLSLPHTRTVACVVCEGRGTNRKKNSVCRVCEGGGSRPIVRQMGMMMQQMSVPCDACGGSGLKVDPRDVCRGCHGRRTTEVESTLTVSVERGMHHQEEIAFPGEGSFDPNTGETGDIVIVLEQVKDETFVRDEDDLQLTHTITVAESLCGFQFIIRHLDGRDLIVRRERGEITRPGEVKVVLGEGMPRRQRPGQYGDLVIKFNVAFPERLEQSQVDALRKALPPPKSVDLQQYDDAEECYVSREDLDHVRRELEEDAREEDEEGPSVGCAAQ